MKVLIHSDEYSPRWGPCSVRCKVFSDTFRQAGDSVTVLASTTNLDEGVTPDDNAVYCRAPAMKSYDPFITKDIVPNQYHDLDAFLNDVDMVVIMVGHRQIREELHRLEGKVVLDTRNVCPLPGTYHL